MNKYDVLLADPPWSYRVWRGKKSRTSDAHYRTMSTEMIADLPISDIVTDDAALFLWSTPPAIHEAIRVVDAWGFRYKTFAFVWIKHDKHAVGQTKCVKGPLVYREGELFQASFGLGHYTRANAEVCLLGIRGHMPVADKSVSQLILSQRRDHSCKPDEQYELIERLYPKAAKLELFARRRRSGWDALGLDIDGRDVRQALLTQGIDTAVSIQTTPAALS
jgi:N6-adenosine-specific RNA methylase IME4